MYIKNMLYKAGTVSASALMALSVCAPALTASANHRRPVSHKRTVRKHKLTRKEKRALRRDNALIKQINGKINQDESQLYKMNAKALNKNLRKHGYAPEQREAILGVVANQTGFTFQNSSSSSKRSFGYFGFNEPYVKGLSKYARKHHESKYSIDVQLNYMSHTNKRNFNGEDGTPVQLYWSLAENYMHQGLVANKNRANSLIKRASREAGLHMSKNDIRDIQTNQEIVTAEQHLGMPYNMTSHNKGARAITNNTKAKKSAGTDAVGFVYGSLKYAGFKVPKRIFSTYNVHKYLSAESAKDAKRGDVVYSHDHIAILAQDYHGSKTRILEEGGAKQKSNISTIRNAFGSHAKLSFGIPEN